MNLLTRIVNKLNRVYIYNKNISKIRNSEVVFEEPNYLYMLDFSDEPCILDVGCAAYPDFSLHIIEKFNYKTIGVDPTRKHFSALAEVEKSTNGKFKHLPYAVANKNEMLTFHESKEHDSGSLLKSHTNVKQDEIEEYEVQAVTINTLIEEIGCKEIDYLKLDLEGIEYSLLEKIDSKDLLACKQLFIEFHHHCIPEFSKKDTFKMVEKIKGIGFDAYTLDDHNYLFVRT